MLLGDAYRNRINTLVVDEVHCIIMQCLEIDVCCNGG